MQEILKQGLHPSQIESLIKLCEVNFDSDPITFFVLIAIFNELLYDFWETEQVPKEDYSRLESTLIPGLLEVWETAGDIRKHALEKLILAYRSFLTR